MSWAPSTTYAKTNKLAKRTDHTHGQEWHSASYRYLQYKIIGEELKVRTDLAKNFDDIRSAILKSNDALVSSKPHQNFLVFLFFKPITLRLLTLD